MISQKMVVVDLETTGNSPKRGDRIIQLSAVTIEKGKIVDQYTTFINPEITIPTFIEELTGINDEMVEGAPSFEEIAPTVLEILDGAVFVAHNVDFDLGFLQSELEEAGYNGFYGPKVDTVELAKISYPTAESYKLTELADRFTLSHDRPHQADSDAYVTALLLIHFIEVLSKLPLVTLETLEPLSKYLKSDLELLLRWIVEKNRINIEELPETIEIYRGIALKKKVELLDSGVFSKEVVYPSDDTNKEELLHRAFSNFERRQSQFQMMDEVYDAFSRKKHLIVEAGTGVGKSLGYLIPALYYSKAMNMPVVISTYTVQLQEQLLQKEVKQLQEMTDFPFHVVLLKGRNHYLNLFKFEQSLREEESQFDVVLTKMQILVWLTVTNTGDIDELNLTSGGMLFWNRIKHDGWHLQKEKDPWISRDFYLYARKQSNQADLIITNHSMLLTDLISDTNLLPSYQQVIIDEGHHLEKAARKHFGKILDYISVKFTTSQLGNLDHKQLYYKLETLLEKYDVQQDLHSFELDMMIGEFYRELDECLNILASTFLKHAKKRKDVQKIQLRLTDEIMSGRAWQPALIATERVCSHMKKIENAIFERLEHIKKKDIKLEDQEKTLVEEVYSFLKDWSQLMEQFQLVFKKNQDEQVIWMEGDLRSLPTSLIIQAQPISVGESLQERLFSKVESAVITSATLTVQSSFNYLLEEIGLLTDNIKQLQLPSPFQYEKNSTLYITNDLPEIQSVSVDEYVEAIAAHLIAIAQATKGRMLVLFTAYDMLRKTHELMKDSGLLEDYVLMAQGISSGSRTKLTKNFQRFDKAILFGTNSFWEGVDIPGEDLSCLIMVRLPFSPPNEPINQSKCDRLKKEGKNAFSSYSLPEAVIRFKQGVGRLIRRSSDRGIVIVFDQRIISTKYGRAFLKSIPSMPVRKGNLEELLQRIEEWL
jgi:ATP-dependent DNA helicase DinG